MRQNFASSVFVQKVCNSMYTPSFVPFERTQCLNFSLIFLYKIMLFANLRRRGNIFVNDQMSLSLSANFYLSISINGVPKHFVGMFLSIDFEYHFQNDF